MTSPYYDPKQLLLEHDLDKELIQQTLELFEFICGNSDFSVPQDKEIQQMFTDAVNKYKDSESLSIEAIKELIAEQGYDYLIDVFVVTDERLRILAAYLPIIQILKGTRPGLELIFTVLNVGFEIKEWWEDPVNLEILSYILFVELFNQPVTTTVIPRIKEFSRQYVYPLLTQVTYAITYKLNKTPYIGAAVYTKTALEVWQKILWLIWSGDASPENIWTDQQPYQDPLRHKSLWQGNLDDQLVWDPNSGTTAEVNMWSESSGTLEGDSVRVWEVDTPNLDDDTDLLYWWINQIILLGKDEESWCTEDKTVEDPIITYWSPDSDSDIDGTLVKLIIIANPSTALIEINGDLGAVANVKKGEVTTYRVWDPDGKYFAESGEVTPLKDTVISVSLEEAKISQCTLSIKALPSNAKIAISTSPITQVTDENNIATPGSKDRPSSAQMTAQRGTTLHYRVEIDKYYYPITGSHTLDRDKTIEIELVKVPFYEFAIRCTPDNARVMINGEERTSLLILEGEKAIWSVDAPFYYGQNGSQVMTENTELDINLKEFERYTLAINPTPSDAKVVINGQERKSIVVYRGESVDWSVSRNFYETKTGTHVVEADSTLNIALDLVTMYTVTLDTTPSNTSVSFSVVSGSLFSQAAKSVTGLPGTVVKYTVTPSDTEYYKSVSGEFTIDSDKTVKVSCPTTGTKPSGSKSTTYNYEYASSGPVSATVNVTGKGPCKVTVSGSASSTSPGFQKFATASVALYTSNGTLSDYKEYSNPQSSASFSKTFTVASGVTITGAMFSAYMQTSASGINKFSATARVSVS